MIVPDPLEPKAVTDPAKDWPQDEHHAQCMRGGPYEVVHFQRRPGPGAFSVERLFEDVRATLPPDIHVTVRINRFHSRGILARICDMIRARWVAGEVNHVLGDVHYLMMTLPRKRSVLTVLDCASLERLSPVNRWLFTLLWYRLPLRRAACVTVISEFTRQALIGTCQYPPERIHVIPPPLSAEFVMSPLPVWTGRMRVLQVGTPSNKNLGRVIEALASLAVTFVVIGVLTNGQSDRMRELGIHCENHVRLSRPQLVDQYRLADVLIFASTYEGFGMPIIEAQAVGRPVVTSRIEPMPSTAGGAACLVDPFDVADIRRGLREVMNNRNYAEDLVRRGFENSKRFASAQIAGQYAAIYRNLQHQKPWAGNVPVPLQHESMAASDQQRGTSASQSPQPVRRHAGDSGTPT